MINVVVLQNIMDLPKGELGSSGKICIISTVDGNNVTGMEAERVSVKVEEEVVEEPETVPIIKSEPEVSGVSVVRVMHISYRLYPELAPHMSLCSYE